MRRSKAVSLIGIFILMVSMLFAACSTTRHTPKRSVKHKHKKERVVKHKKQRIPNISNLTGMRKKIVEASLEWEGTPYKYAGYSKKTGTDCSGMVLTVYLETTGIKLPRNSAKQAEYCKRIKPSQVLPGDLVFFATGKDPDKVSHVGIMIDDDNFIHASTSKGVVISSVSTPYYQRTFMGYGRAL